MNLYPAMHFHMGAWEYFVVRMNMRELAENVQFASDVYEDKTLDEAIQRVLNESRVKRDIVRYLQRQKDRFFSSVVVAALGGEPKWYPVSIENDPQFQMFRDDRNLNEAFGFLAFDGQQSYYALDGQHRLAAIKALLDRNSDASLDAPEGFANEQVSVVVVVPTRDETNESFMIKYRRLFGNLNRYAKPMDPVTNIIMDEDDAFAIVTRRLVSEHPFFKSAGRHKDSTKIKTTKGKNLKSSDSYFTSLETLYEMNIALLNSRQRRNSGWDELSSGLDEFRRLRPEDEVIDSLYDELSAYWDALIESLPVLNESPTSHRRHSLDDESEEHDTAVFWPIGQELLADVAREALDHYHATPSREDARRALSKLGQIDWELHNAPWRHLMLVPDGSNSWKMRSEERKVATALARRIVQWQLGVDELDHEGVADLKSDWEKFLQRASSANQQDVSEMWKEIERGRVKHSG